MKKFLGDVNKGVDDLGKCVLNGIEMYVFMSVMAFALKQSVNIFYTVKGALNK